MREAYREICKGVCDLVVASFGMPCVESLMAGPSWLGSVLLGLISKVGPYSPVESCAFYLIGKYKTISNDKCQIWVNDAPHLLENFSRYNLALTSVTKTNWQALDRFLTKTANSGKKCRNMARNSNLWLTYLIVHWYL